MDTRFLVKKYLVKKRGATSLSHEPLARTHALRALRALFDGYEGIPKLALNHLMYCHDSGKFLCQEYFDANLAEFLRGFVAAHGNNTVLFIQGDHGSHQGSTPGHFKVSNKSPAMSVVVPRWFVAKYPDAGAALRASQTRLVTPLEVYATARHLLESFPRPASEAAIPPASFSLFDHTRRIPPGRTCKDALVVTKTAGVGRGARGVECDCECADMLSEMCSHFHR